MTHLTPAQCDFFYENGYLVVEDVFSDSDLQPVWDEYVERLDTLAQRFFAAGHISSPYTDLPFGERYTAMMAEYPQLIDYLELTLPLTNEQITPETEPSHGPAVFNLITHPNLLDVVESILGGEFCSNPVQHIRLKPPFRKVKASVAENSYVGKTTWHQDLTGLLDEANETQVLTTWVAITDAPKERGPLVVIPRSHKKGGGTLTTHCAGKGIAVENYIPSKLLGDDMGGKEVIPLPVRRGSVVLLSCFTEHAALSNTSDKLRWSFDLRWHPIGQPSGRPAFPEFIARSRSNPSSELRDPVRWKQLWEEAKWNVVNGRYSGNIYNIERLEKFANSPVCA